MCGISEVTGYRTSILSEGQVGSQENFVNTYDFGDKYKLYDIALAYGVGAGYSQNYEHGYFKNHSANAGFNSVGASYNWSNGHVNDNFWGLDISGKIALGWGVKGSIKIGFINIFK
ncbi:MAG: hypothetical protein PHV20_07060 [Bacteroidales bacterium]|nr:hypothetical protein [Bacteroidales bacterium]